MVKVCSHVSSLPGLCKPQQRPGTAFRKDGRLTDILRSKHTRGENLKLFMHIFGIYIYMPLTSKQQTGRQLFHQKTITNLTENCCACLTEIKFGCDVMLKKTPDMTSEWCVGGSGKNKQLCCFQHGWRNVSKCALLRTPTFFLQFWT